MALIPDLTAFQQSLASLPIAVYEPGEDVIEAGSTTGQLFILKVGAVEVLRDGIMIAKVSEPGAVFGELSVILGKPHSAHVRALERSEFHVAEASSLLKENVTALAYVTAILARRFEAANEVLIEIKRQSEGEKRGPLSRALDKLENLLVGPNNPDFYYYNPMF